MTPVERAAAVYAREPCARTFREDLEAHLLHGYVWSSPTAFVMARPVNRLAPRELIVNPWHVFAEEEVDCWLVYLAAGCRTEIWGACPKWLPFVMWERNNVLRTYYAQRVKRLCTHSSFSPLHGSSS